MKKPLVVWKNGDLNRKIAIQNMLFPDGLIFSREDGFGTTKTNAAYGCIDLITKDFQMYGLCRNDANNLVVGQGGLEPPTSAL